MKHAQLIWDETGTPCSTEFDDVYFSKVGGLDETRHVFLDHNQLPERFSEVSTSNSPQSFVIAETGFGTGLNFLAACQLWTQRVENASECSTHKLTFISTEKFPLTLEDLKKALSVWPELTEWSTPLIEHYPQVCEGFQTLKITDNITLILTFGDAANSFEKLNASIDAWFLDGFAPSKNPEMWSDSLFSQIQRLSSPSTTFATFTAARVVKDLLTNHGFNFRKAKGFGRKRDMIHGEFDESREEINTKANTEPWFQPPKPVKNKANQKHAVIIGAGLSGAHTARALAKRGWIVTVIEQANQIAAGASGNYQGVLYTKPSIQPTKEDSFYLATFQYAVQHFNTELKDTDLWKQVGLLQLAYTDKESTKLEKVSERYKDTEFNRLLSKAEAESLAELSLSFNSDNSALFYPSSGWVNPAETCKALLDHPNITVQLNTQVISLTKDAAHWNVKTNTDLITAPIVVLATANQSQKFVQAEHFPLTPIRGQVSQIDLSSSALENTSTASPKTVICGDSYLTPVNGNKLNFGATFDLKDEDTDYREEDILRNLSKLLEISSEYDELSDLATDQITGRASIRCITSDRLPIVGMINNHPAMLEQYQELRKDRKWPYTEPGNYHQGLYANLGHGSKGLTTIPLCSELLCSMIEERPLPLEQSLVDALNPARFTIKGLIQKKF
jgi:tRNA 5-methylaminomethyl-2-thiouridine biosynthesis bifunctional protein